MRKSIALTEREVIRAAAVRSLLNVGERVTLSYVKRDGTESTLTGRVESLKGEGDKETVTVETDKGYRSANMYRILSVS